MTVINIPKSPIVQMQKSQELFTLKHDVHHKGEGNILNNLFQFVKTTYQNT